MTINIFTFESTYKVKKKKKKKLPQKSMELAATYDTNGTRKIIRRNGECTKWRWQNRARQRQCRTRPPQRTARARMARAVPDSARLSKPTGKYGPYARENKSRNVFAGCANDRNVPSAARCEKRRSLLCRVRFSSLCRIGCGLFSRVWGYGKARVWRKGINDVSDVV